LAPIVTAFQPFAYNYAIKLFLDTMAAQEVCTYTDFLFPIVLFLGAQLISDVFLEGQQCR